ncbi:6-phosphofructokinase 2 [Sphingobacterium zeae]|uniref:6-phosphofructokinase 2 n=1 Tax=Sphingobacterium zeae TaxID=1776859 RepID=A0ABU0U5V4_9SPHI|nr:1-phosphofructokinase family hexose kinase [Sphingobacterium zeae]MDQ1150351.1 6-phosphofructokinase 2 [Sphingobacterium zeae]
MAKSILTITLNPSVDKSSSVQHIVPEKKLRCEQPIYQPGGGGINVSRALKRLGLASTALFTSGGKTGGLLESLLKLEDIAVDPIRVNGETRENFIVVERSTNQQYRFGFPGEHVESKELEGIMASIAELKYIPDFVVISGSMPAGVPPEFIRSLIHTYKTKGSKIIVDTSGESLRVALEEGLFLIKPNAGELAALVGKEELGHADLDMAAQQLISEGKATLIVVSLGAQGAILYSETERIQLSSPVVKVRSTVGAGDSMVAGMVSVLAQQGDLKQVLQMGIACGSATTMAEGTGLFAKKDVDRLFSEIKKR